MASTLGKMLSTKGKTKGITPTPTGVLKVNKVKGSPRENETYIDVTDANGITVHRYGVEGTNKDVSWDKSRSAAGVKQTAATPAALPKPAAAKPRGGLVNQIKASPRYGMTFKVTTRNGMPGHLYSNGHFEPMGRKS